MIAKLRDRIAQLEPVARPNADTIRSMQRAAAEAASARFHSQPQRGDPHAVYLKDILERLLTQPASRLAEPLPHRWQRRDAAQPCSS
jgi:hypothetical protein